MLRVIKIILGVPALLIHELSHVISILLLGAKGNGIEVNGHIDDFGITVHYNTNRNWKKNIITLAPLGGFIIWSFLLLLTSGFIFYGLVIYTLLYIDVFFPSEHDIQTYRTKLIQDSDIEIPKLEK